MAQNGITYVLNASNTCPKPDFISDNHFLRIPVNDSYCEKLLPWLEKTNEFIGKNAAATLFPINLNFFSVWSRLKPVGLTQTMCASAVCREVWVMSAFEVYE